MHYWCVFEVFIGKLSSCKCRTKSTSFVLLVEHYTRRLMRKGTLWRFRANMRFLNLRVALDFESTPLKTVLKNLDLPQSNDCFRNTKSAWVFYWLFGTFHVFAASALYPSSFEPSSFSSSLTGRSRRTLVSAYAQGHFLLSNPNWKRLVLMTNDWCATQSDSHNACNISSAPLRSDGLERRISGKAPRGLIYLRTRSTGPERPTPLHLGPTKTATHLARSLWVRIGVVRFEKKFGRQPVR